LENFKEDITSKKAASLAYLNEAAFCRYFKRQTKKTFSQFVNQVRITHAISLLQDKNLSVGDVCYECGFNTLSYFNRQFKVIINKSPLEYRKLYFSDNS
jgi:AraC-like DNA-binding protein